MKPQIFRAKSLQRVASVEPLDEYARLTNPSISIIILAAIILAFGAIVWSVYGQVAPSLNFSTVADNGAITCFIPIESIDDIKEGMQLEIEGEYYRVEEIASTPTRVDNERGSYFLEVGRLNAGDWVFEVTLAGSLPNGVYQAELALEE